MSEEKLRSPEETPPGTAAGGRGAAGPPVASPAMMAAGLTGSGRDPNVPAGRFLALAALLGLVGFLRFSALDFGRPSNQARPDEAGLIEEALADLRGDPHAHLLAYPSGFPRLLSAWLSLLLERREPERDRAVAATELEIREPMRLQILARGLSAALAFAAAVVTALAAKRRGLPWLAAFLFAGLAPLAVLHGHFATVDASALFLASLSVLPRLEGDRGDRRLGGPLFAAFAAGLAAGFKYTFAVALLPALVRALGREGGWKGRFPALLVVLAAFVLGLGLASPVTLVDLPTVLDALRHEADGQAIRRGDLGIVGALVFHLRVSLAAGLGEGVFLAAITGLLVARRGSGRWILGLPAAALLAVHATTGVAYSRYLIPALPGLGLAAAAGFESLRRRLPQGLDLLALALLLLPSLIRDLAIQASLSRRDTRGELVLAVRDGRLPADLPVLAPRWPFEAFPLADDMEAIDLARRGGRFLCPDRAAAFRRLAEPILAASGRPPRLLRYGVGDDPKDLEILARGEGFLVVLPDVGNRFGARFGLPEVKAMRALLQEGERAGRWHLEPRLLLDPGPGEDAVLEADDFFFTPLGRPLACARPGPRIEVWRVRAEIPPR